jgi:hypothetical protein
MITPLQLVSLSDFVLAIICLFLSGVLHGKSNVFYSKKHSSKLILFLFFVGLAAFMGGVDHGFFQTIDQRYIPTTSTYLCIALATYFLFQFTIQTYFSSNFKKLFSVIAIIQLVIFASLSFYLHNFLLVIANYSPVLILFLIFNLINIKSHQSNKYFTLTCLLFMVATLVQSFGIQISEMLNESTLYHIISMFAYIIFYWGVIEVLKQEYNK